MTKKSPAPAKRRISRKKKVAVATVALIGVGGAAFAYWTTTGIGTGSAGAASSFDPVSIEQTGAPTGMGPGVAPQSLTGTINNQNTGPAHVNSITASIDSVDGTTAPADTDGCNPNDFVITGSSGPYDAAVGDGTTWSGLSIQFVNKAENQDACKGATVHITYAAS